MVKIPSPEKLLRIVVLLCLVAVAIIFIATAHRVAASIGPDVSRNQDLAIYFMISLGLFGLFYGQYWAVQRVTKGALNPTIGNIQVAGSSALLLYGAVGLLHPWSTENPQLFISDFLTRVPISIGVVGEAAFIVNVIWSHFHPQRLLASAPTAPEVAAENWGWPQSPAKLFGIAAAFLVVLGVLSLVLNFPSWRFSFLVFSRIHRVPMAVVWIVIAGPFAFFALLYWLIAAEWNLKFEDSMNRIHLVATLVAALDMFRIAMSWAMSTASTMKNPYLQSDSREVWILLSVASAIFAVNIFQSYRRSSLKAS